MFCLVCGEPITDQSLIRLRQGGLKLRRWGHEFLPDVFEDDEEVKFLHECCAREHSIHLSLLEEGTCRLCHFEIEPEGTNQPADCVLQVEHGILQPSKKGPFLVFFPSQLAHVHYMCACDEWDLPLLDLYDERFT